MIWHFIFMLAGATFVALGMWLGMQATLSAPDYEEEEEYAEKEPELPARVMRQWENLLNYDGTTQEDDLDEN